MHIFVIALTIFTLTVLNNLQAKDTKEEKPQILVPTRYVQLVTDPVYTFNKLINQPEFKEIAPFFESLSADNLDTAFKYIRNSKYTAEQLVDIFFKYSPKVILMHVPQEYRADLRVALPGIRKIDKRLLLAGLKIIRESDITASQMSLAIR